MSKDINLQQENQEQKKEYERIYCPTCGKCLYEEAIFMGKVRIKCYNCNTVVIFERIPEFEEPQMKIKRPKKTGKK